MSARHAALLAGLLSAGPALAEPALLAFEHGETRLAFAAADIADVQTMVDLSNQPALHVSLADGAARAFSAFTGQVVGQQVKVFVCDVMVVTPVIQTPIESGGVVLGGAVLNDDKVLRGKLLARSCQ